MSSGPLWPQRLAPGHHVVSWLFSAANVFLCCSRFLCPPPPRRPSLHTSTVSHSPLSPGCLGAVPTLPHCSLHRNHPALPEHPTSSKHPVHIRGAPPRHVNVGLARCPLSDMGFLFLCSKKTMTARATSTLAEIEACTIGLGTQSGGTGGQTLFSRTL